MLRSGTLEFNTFTANAAGVTVEHVFGPAGAAGAVVGNNVFYGNATGVRDITENPLWIVNNTFVTTASEFGFDGTTAIRSGDDNRGGTLTVENNIFAIAADTAAFTVQGQAQSGFESDWNLFDIAPGGRLADWDGAEFATLVAWQASLGRDLNGLAADPLFVDLVGPDGILAIDDDGADGSHDNVPLLLPGSPAIDRGNPASRFDREPEPNGRRIDIGHTGNSPLATASATETVQVLLPRRHPLRPRSATRSP